MNKITLLDIDFHFGLGFLNELIDGTGLSLEELGQENNIKLIPKLMYYSSQYASNRIGKTHELTIYNIYDLIDENGGMEGKFCTEFAEAFWKSMSKDVPVSEDKKKAEVNG